MTTAHTYPAKKISHRPEKRAVLFSGRGAKAPISHRHWSHHMGVGLDLGLGVGLVNISCFTGKKNSCLCRRDDAIPERSEFDIKRHLKKKLNKTFGKELSNLLDKLMIMDELIDDNDIYKGDHKELKYKIGEHIQRYSKKYLKEAVYIPHGGDMNFYEKILKKIGGKFVLRTLIFETSQHEQKSLDLITLYKSCQGDITFTDKNGRTPLHYVIYSSIIKKLINYGVDVNKQDKEGKTALHLSKTAEVIKELINNGSDVNIKDMKGNTALHFSCKDGNVYRIAALIDAGINVNAINTEGQTPLHILTHIEDIKLLITAGGEIDIKDNKGRTPLHVVQNADKARVLLACGADVNAEDKEGNTPLHLVKDVEIATIYVINSANIEKGNKKGEIPEIIRNDPEFTESVLFGV